MNLESFMARCGFIFIVTTVMMTVVSGPRNAAWVLGELTVAVVVSLVSEVRNG